MISWRVRIMLGLMALVLLMLHLWVVDRVRDDLGASLERSDEPKRLAVAYVRELKPTAPVARYAAPPPLAAAEPVKKKAAPVSAVASAPERLASAPRQERFDEQAAIAANKAAMQEALAAAEAAVGAASAASATGGEEEAASRTAEAGSAAKDAPDGAEAAARAASSASSVASADQAPQPGSARDAAATPSGDPNEVSSSPPPDTPGAQPFEWPASTRVSYVLTGNYRGEVHGSAQVEWVRDGDHYQVHLDVVVGADFAPLFTRKMSSDGRITARGLAPKRYDESSKLAFQNRRVNAVIFGDDEVTLSNGSKAPRPPGVMVQDSASQFVQLTWLFSTRPELLQVGRSIDMPLALPRSLDTWVYDVVGNETLYTPFGNLDALHLKPRRHKPTDNARTNAITAEMWIAPTLAYLPARIVIHQNEETYIDLMITRLPQLGAVVK